MRSKLKPTISYSKRDYTFTERCTHYIVVYPFFGTFLEGYV